MKIEIHYARIGQTEPMVFSIERSHLETPIVRKGDYQPEGLSEAVNTFLKTLLGYGDRKAVVYFVAMNEDKASILTTDDFNRLIRHCHDQIRSHFKQSPKLFIQEYESYAAALEVAHYFTMDEDGKELQETPSEPNQRYVK